MYKRQKYDEVQSEIELICKDINAAQEDRVEIEEMLYSTEANILQLIDTFNAVSYTHLDVYKRQVQRSRGLSSFGIAASNISCVRPETELRLEHMKVSFTIWEENSIPTETKIPDIPTGV